MEDSAREVTFSAVCFGVRRNSQGTLDTDKLFTGQRLDDTGLYFYNARYYDAAIGRFISADTIVQDYTNPQTLNRYSYCNNNPLKYIDPSGHNWFTDWWTKSVPDFFCGIGSGIADAATGLWDAITHPVETIQSIGYAITHPVETVKAVWNTFYNNCQTAHGIGENVGGILALFAPGGIAKAAGRVGQITGLTEKIAGLGATRALPGFWNPFAKAPSVGDKVYRAFGADARGYGNYWTRTNPLTIENYANVAGLPSKKGIFGYAGGRYNSGGFIAEGRIASTEGMQIGIAQPLHGKLGGIDELWFPNPQEQIIIDKVYGVNPWLNP